MDKPLLYVLGGVLLGGAAFLAYNYWQAGKPVPLVGNGAPGRPPRPGEIEDPWSVLPERPGAPIITGVPDQFQPNVTHMGPGSGLAGKYTVPTPEA
jgi:hypothetical protein